VLAILVKFPFVTRPWALPVLAAFADGITVVRHWLWMDWIIETPGHYEAFTKIRRPLQTVLLHALAPAASAWKRAKVELSRFQSDACGTGVTPSSEGNDGLGGQTLGFHWTDKAAK
jgi:hypothetical protein